MARTHTDKVSASISPSEQYKRYLERLLSLLYDSLVLKAAAWRELSAGFERGGYVERAPVAVLWLCVEALETDIVLSLSRLLEGDRSDRNVLRFLNFVEVNRRIIDWKEPLTAAQLMAHKSALESHREIINAVLAQRDKYFAHADKEFFLDPDARHQKFPFAFSDVVDVVRTIQRILTDHSKAFEGHMRVSMDGFAANAAAQLFYIVASGTSATNSGLTPD